MSTCCGSDSTPCGCDEPAGRALTITWQRLLNDSGGTCPRCAGTAEAVVEARETLGRVLAPLGIDVVLETRALDMPAFRSAPGESNRIWIDGRPLEDWVGASVRATPCCDECGDADCRAVEVEGTVHEVVPAEVIVRAGLIAAAAVMAAPRPTN